MRWPNAKAGSWETLKDHTEDFLASRWDRFSWFGFNPVGEANAKGILQLQSLVQDVTEDTSATIRDLEALLI